MICRSFTSQRGFSLFRFLIMLVIFVLAILYFLPRIGGDTFTVINQISAQAKAVINDLISKLSGVRATFSEEWSILGEKVSKKIGDLKDWLRRIQGKGALTQTRGMDWEADMQMLIELSEEQDYKMEEVRLLRDQGASQRRVEAEFWNQLQTQTADLISKNITRFRTRPLGCSDFTVELKKIWDIGQKFNEETFEGYLEAKKLSEELEDPRSLEFAQDVFGWIGFQNSDWFMEQLTLAITKTDKTIPDYPAIIDKIDSRISQARYIFDRVLGDITVGEIYLNYNLVNPAESRFDEAIRNLATVLNQYSNTISPEKVVGLHMALGLLNERVCKNNDLAIKEFKDVLVGARRLGLDCQYCNIAHYHLGIINLKLREGTQVKPGFEGKPSSYAGTTETLLTTTPTPAPTPTPTPTPAPNPIKIIVEIPLTRALKAEEKTARAIPGVTKGEVTVPRPVRLRPRKELGESQQMKTFKVEDLYDLRNIPDDAIREFELYLKCTKEGTRAEIARFIHNKYMGK
jgi:hypothetical protein